MLLRLLYLREYIIPTFYQATILSAGLPLIERWPFNDRCWYRFVQLKRLMVYAHPSWATPRVVRCGRRRYQFSSRSQCGGNGKRKLLWVWTLLLLNSSHPPLSSTISYTRCGYHGRHKDPFLSCDSDETRHIVWGEFDSVIYIAVTRHS